jgi:hypothetical protein
MNKIKEYIIEHRFLFPILDPRPRLTSKKEIEFSIINVEMKEADDVSTKNTDQTRNSETVATASTSTQFKDGVCFLSEL